MRSIYVPLPEGAADRLWELAQRELRDPRAQAARLILDGLERAGLPVPHARHEPEDLDRKRAPEPHR